GDGFYFRPSWSITVDFDGGGPLNFSGKFGGYLDPDSRARTRFGGDRRPAAESLGPFGNAEQAKMPFARAGAVFSGEAGAVIGDLERDSLRPEFEADVRARRAGMFDGVGERLLHDAEQIFLDDLRQRTDDAGGLELDPDVRAVRDLAAAV